MVMLFGSTAMPSQTFQLERIDTPTGRMLLVMQEDGSLCAADWEDYDARMRHLLRRYHGDNIHLQERSGRSDAGRALEAYFEGAFDAIIGLPTATMGTPFQREVWAGLHTIPVGTTLSYGVLAQQIGHPKAVRAVGLANGSNPVAIIVPCHRVIGADSSLTGYGGGLERKRWLLKHEGGMGLF
jgi:methylated-DNA-[protein]-cysteine S-methyltransferase